MLFVKRLNNRVTLLMSQVFFTAALLPLFLFPGLAATRPMRRLVAYMFGHLLASRYHRVIEFYGQSYGTALAAGLEKAASLSTASINTIVDCGTGTGYAAGQAARRFPEAFVVGVDVVPGMLDQAQRNFQSEKIHHISAVCADTLRLPFADGAIDLVIAQNTIPFLAEFARVCRPGGTLVFVDTAARWIPPLVRRVAPKAGRFDTMVTEAAGLGFYLVARRAK